MAASGFVPTRYDAHCAECRRTTRFTEGKCDYCASGAAWVAPIRDSLSNATLETIVAAMLGHARTGEIAAGEAAAALRELGFNRTAELASSYAPAA